ncbi:hypothetical protein M3Y94_00591800 [Aphelenchoides besseyi]|nr:hypothetical protein M3Y94_00591800 [Aphelenchoides besseyi]KAI6222138.1 Cytochrome b561 domain-containing protein [Aphelenchoides besseyi]
MRLDSRRFVGFAIFVLLSVQADQSLFDDSTCGSGKKCEKAPKGCDSAENCNAMISYAPVDDQKVEFELWAPISDGINYLALGFSRDKSMGDDAVTYCYDLGSDDRGIGMGVTEGKRFKATENSTMVDDTVKLEEIRVEDGQFYCKFTQKINSGSNGGLLMPDLSDQKYHLLMVRGPATEKNRLGIHKFDEKYGPVITGTQNLVSQPSADLSPNNSNVASTQEESSNEQSTDGIDHGLLKRLHGAIMLIAWLGLVSCAVYSARHLREHYPNTTVNGLMIWFHIHRTFNVIAVVLMVLAAILIFVGTSYSWTGPSVSQTSDENTSATAIHSLLGVISVVLALSQPFIALLRCGKDHPKRPIFNVVHRSFGLLAALLAVITISIAIFGSEFAFSWKNRSTVKIIFAIFLVVTVIILLLQEVLRARDRREQQKIVAIEMHNRSKTMTPVPSDNYYYQNRLVHSDRYRHITSVLFFVFAALSVATAFVLAYMTFISN